MQTGFKVLLKNHDQMNKTDMKKQNKTKKFLTDLIIIFWKLFMIKKKQNPSNLNLWKRFLIKIHKMQHFYSYFQIYIYIYIYFLNNFYLIVCNWKESKIDNLRRTTFYRIRFLNICRGNANKIQKTTTKNHNRMTSNVPKNDHIFIFDFRK